MAAAQCEPHSPKEKLPLAPEELREEVKKPVQLRPTQVVEKIILPTEDDIKFEKQQDAMSPILNAVSAFDKNKLRHSQPDEKNLLPTPEEYNQIKTEKKEFREAISKFDQGKLKHVTTEEKHDVAAIDEAGDK